MLNFLLIKFVKFKMKGRVIMLKDDKLSFIYNTGNNIARFMSISPEYKIRHINIDKEYFSTGDIKEHILNLINVSSRKSVNIRSFSEECVKSNRFVYGKKLEDIDEIIDIIKENCAAGKYSIVNETIDVNDGGVSGVIMGNIIEFSPNDTPRCVEKEGVCRLPLNLGLHMLKTVYGFSPEYSFGDNYRTEFSIHPNREGLREGHTIIWEYEGMEKTEFDIKILYPNNFSKFIGDKVFGLLLADFYKFNVPYTTVICRNVAPFTFGKFTGLNEKWIRTSPIVKESGKYFTGNKWQDPFKLIIEEESKGDKDINISSILSQSAVNPVYSGGAIISSNSHHIEGVSGKGDEFMLGNDNFTKLPIKLKRELEYEFTKLSTLNDILGDVSVEWVYDGSKIWIVQLNRLKHTSKGNIIVKGNPSEYMDFDVRKGLNELRVLINSIKDKNVGVKLIGNVGITSHFGDILRQFDIPSFIENIPV